MTLTKELSFFATCKTIIFVQVKIDYDNDDGHDSDFEVSEEEVDDEVSGRDEREGGDSYYYHINSEE